MTEKFATIDAGAPVPSVEHSLSVGPDGPILLQDHYLIEQMANFNRERIPERQPHAKGGGAFGHWSPGSPPWPASVAAQTPGVIRAGSRRSFTPPKATSAWLATTPRCSSSAAR